MGETNHQKTDAEYEAEFQRYLDAQKAKEKANRKKAPRWIILATVIAVVLVVVLFLAKPWSAFEEKDKERADIYSTVDSMEGMNQDAQYAAMAEEGSPEINGAQNPETVPEGAAATEAPPEEPPTETPAEAQPEPPSETQTPPAETAPPATEEETTSPHSNPDGISADDDVDTTVTTVTHKVANDDLSGIVATGDVVQDNAGLLAPLDLQQVVGTIQSGDLAFRGIDFFVVTNYGNNGTSNTRYATNYYKKLRDSGKTNGNGIVIFINRDDMTTGIATAGTADKILGSSGRSELMNNLIGVYSGSGSFSDAIISTYNMAQDMVENYEESETSSDTSDGWVELDE